MELISITFDHELHSMSNSYNREVWFTAETDVGPFCLTKSTKPINCLTQHNPVRQKVKKNSTHSNYPRTIDLNCKYIQLMDVSGIEQITQHNTLPGLKMSKS